MATILLSIKPEYANRIFDGSKKYEFRKHLPQQKIDKIVVYSTDPVQRVIGEVEVSGTLSMNPTPLWESTKKAAGISREKYRKYFHGCQTANAFILGHLHLFETPRLLSDYGVKSAPQFFVYLENY